jgi:hypothetical protein
MPESTTYWAFLYFYYMDKANACMHLAPVRFSPITFSMAERLEKEYQDDDIEAEILADLVPGLQEVQSHRGRYEVDPGR